MAEMVIKTRITPKKLHDSVISRDRLIGLIKTNVNKNIILIVGPAGFGKTTLVIDYFQQSNKKYAWLYLAPDINSFSSFIGYLVHSLRELNADFGSKTLELLGSMIESGVLVKDEKNSINALIGTLSNEFVNTFSDDTYIVIDDLHNTGNPEWLTSAFNCLIEDFPANLHIFITSRSLPEFNYPRLNAKRNLFRLDAGELTFNIEETAKLLNEIYSINSSEKDLKALDEKAEGWITGLHLILQAYGKNFSSILSSDKKIDENIFMYFAEEIFKSLDDATKEFLIITSMVDTFNENLCNSIPGINNSARIIEALKNKNIFLESSVSESSASGDNVNYSYHNLFKQFLYSKLNELRSAKEIENAASHIFEYYLKSNDVINAIEFSLFAKNFTKAAELISANFEDLFTAGRYEQLEKWINSLPEETIAESNRLKYYKGTLLKQFRINLESAERIFTEISGSEKKDSKYYTLSRTDLADILIFKGKPQEAVVILNELLADCSETRLRIKVLLSLVKAYYNQGAAYYSDILRTLDEALKLCDENEIREYHAEIYSYFGKFYLNAGEFSRALHYFKNVVELEKNIYRRFQTITDIVLLYSWSGEYVKAKQALDDAYAIYEGYPIFIFKRDLMRVTSLNALENGDFEQGIEKLTELNTFDAKNNIKSSSFWYYMLIGEAYILLGQKEKAKEYFHLAEDIKDPKDEHQKLEFDLHLAILKKNEKPDTQVEKVLLSSLKYFESHNLIYSKSQVEFYLADFYYKTGKLQTALKYMKDSLDMASEKGFNSFLTQDFIPKRYLFDLAVANKVQIDFILSIYSRLLEKENYSWLSEDCRKRWKKQSASLYDIKLNTFGGIEIFVRGNSITEDKWIRKKSKLLLAYLLINKDLKHTKEKVLTLFFGDLSTTSAENIFHQSITNIRNVVKPYTEAPDEQLSFKGKKTKHEKTSEVAVSESFIHYEDKILRIAPAYNYYSDVNEFIKLANHVKSIESDEKDKEMLAMKAIDIYKGEFLPGYYDDWVEEMRMNLQNRFIEVCEDLIKILISNCKYDDVAYYSEKLIAEDKLHSEAYVNIIDAYAKTGNMNMAKKKFSQLLKNYEEEYGEKPDKEVLNRIEQILLT